MPAEEVRVADLPGDVASAGGKASITDRSAVGRIQGSAGVDLTATAILRYPV